jgi:hypothetical protein
MSTLREMGLHYADKDTESSFKDLIDDLWTQVY